MAFTKSKTKVHEKREHSSTWEQLINEASRQLAESKLRTGKLKKAVEYFRRQREAGEKPPDGVLNQGREKGQTV